MFPFKNLDFSALLEEEQRELAEHGATWSVPGAPSIQQCLPHHQKLLRKHSQLGYGVLFPTKKRSRSSMAELCDTTGFTQPHKLPRRQSGSKGQAKPTPVPIYKMVESTKRWFCEC